MAYASGYPLQGRLVFQGLRVSIEQKKGSYREDKNHTPPRWRTKMQCHYGYIQGSEGVDGDHVDCFIGPNPEAARAYIVRQVRPDTGAFDEQKVMLGFDTIAEARAMYLKHYDTPKFFGGIRVMPMEEFKRKVLETLHGESLIKSLKTLPPEIAMVARAQAYADKMASFRICWCGDNFGPETDVCPSCGETYVNPEAGCPFAKRNREMLAAHGLPASFSETLEKGVPNFKGRIHYESRGGKRKRMLGAPVADAPEAATPPSKPTHIPGWERIAQTFQRPRPAQGEVLDPVLEKIRYLFHAHLHGLLIRDSAGKRVKFLHSAFHEFFEPKNLDRKELVDPFKRERARFIHFVLPTLLSPVEIWETEDGARAYIGNFASTRDANDSVTIVVYCPRKKPIRKALVRPWTHWVLTVLPHGANADKYRTGELDYAVWRDGERPGKVVDSRRVDRDKEWTLEQIREVTDEFAQRVAKEAEKKELRDKRGNRALKKGVSTTLGAELGGTTRSTFHSTSARLGPIQQVRLSALCDVLESIAIFAPLVKSMVAGHWRDTHGGGRVWIEPYEDKRIVHERPKNEQNARAGDSLLLFPELGHVRPIKEAPKAKPKAPPVNQLSMFSEFKSLDAVEESAPNLQYETPALRADIAACAMLAAHSEDGDLAHKLRVAAARRAQAETLALQFYGGLIGVQNIEALRAVVAYSPFEFRVALHRLQEELSS